MLGADRQCRREREHRGQREPVVEPRLEVQRVPHEARHPRVGDDARGQHRVGGREQRAEQEALGPGQTGQQRASPARRSRQSAASPARACAAAGASAPEASRPRPRARRGTGSRSARRSRARRRTPSERRSARTPVTPGPRTNPISTNSAVSDRKLRRAIPDTSAPSTSTAPKTSRAVSKRRVLTANSNGICTCATATRLECQSHERGAVCGSPCWASHRPGRTLRGHAAATWCRSVTTRCCSTAATACSRSCGASVTTSTSTPSLISHLHADHFLDLVPFSYALTYAPRQQPVPVGGWPGTDHPARPQLYAPVGATEFFRQRRRLLGQRGPDRERVRAARVRRSRRARGRARSRCASARCPTTRRRTRSSWLCNGGRLTYSADCSPNEELVRFARDTDMLLIEATLPRPERTGVRGHLTPREAGEHAPPGSRQARRADPLLRRARRRLGAARRPATAYGRPVELAHEGAVYTTAEATRV